MRTTRDLLHRLATFFFVVLSASSTQAQTPTQIFAQPTVIPTGNWPAAIYSADINNDGYPDLVYIDQGATPTAATTHVLLNDGHGNFTPSATLATAGSALAVADVDADGHPDIVWAVPGPVTSASTSNATVWIARGKGDGTFAGSAIYGNITIQNVAVNPGTPPWMPVFSYFATGHITLRTGALDVLIEDTANGYFYEIQPLSSRGTNIAYQLPADLSSGVNVPATGPILLNDINGDGFDEAIIALSSRHQIVTYSRGLSGLADVEYAMNYPSVHSVLVQDVNYDGIPDLILEGAAGHIDVFPGNGDGTFQTTSIGGTGPLDGTTGNGGHLIALGDFNHDNLIDALTATPAGISTLLGNGTAYLGLNGIYNAGPGGNGGPPSSSNTPAYAVADFNHDGNLDLALDSPEGIAILYGNPDGTFQTSRAYAAGFPAESGALSLFLSTKGILGDNDPTGPVDAVVGIGAAQAMLLYGNGDGTFHFHSQPNNPNQPGPTTDTPGAPGLIGTVFAVDMNVDGKIDIAIAADGPPSAIPASGTGVVIQEGDGTGNFTAPIPLFGEQVIPCLPGGSVLFGSAATPASGDILNDLSASLMILTRNLNTLQAFSAPSFFPYDISANGPCASYPHNLIAAGSLTSSLLGDAIYQAGSHIWVLLANPYSIWNIGASSDLSVDGSATTPGQMVAPQLSDTFGGVSPTLGFPAFPGSAVIRDIDGDGVGDVIIAYDNMGADHTAPMAANPNYIYIWYNSGGGKFLTSAKHPVNPVRLTPSRNFYQVVVHDVNGDKIPDLILSDGYIVSVQLGKGDGTFGPEQHFLAGQGVNTISVGDINHDGKEDLVVANGGTVFGNPVANKDFLTPNPDVNTGGITVLLNQTTPLVTLTGTVTASPEPSTFGNSFLLTATLQPATGSPAPTGTVIFSVDGAVVSSTPINGLNTPGVLYPAPNTLALGAHTLTAAYSGDSNYTPATFTGTHVVTAAATANSILATPEPSVAGAPFTITATALGAGTFGFSVDGNPIGTVVSTTNTASISGPTTLTPGTHTIAAAWTATQSALATLISGTHVVTVNPTTLSLLLCVDNPGSLFPCATPISATPLKSPVTMFYGQSIDGVATQSASNVTGNIVFYDNTTVFCTISANLTGGANTCPPTSGYLHAGTRTIHALYTGDANNAASTSNSIAVNVFPDPTAATVVSSANPAVVRTNVIFTAKVTGNYATPIGSVTFYDGSLPMATLNLDPSGQAIFTTQALAIGSHPITVAYTGTSDFNPVTTPLLTQIITPAIVAAPPGTPASGFTLTVTPAPITVGAGATGILLVTVKTAPSFTQSVQLSCSGLPQETSCIFVAPTLPAGGGATTLQLHVSAPHDCNTNTPYFIGNTSTPGKGLGAPGPGSDPGKGLGAPGLDSQTWVSGSAAALLLAIFARRRRKNLLRPILLLLIALGSLASLSGCGHCTDLGTRPGSYTFTVSGVASGETESQTIHLTVTIP